MKQANRWIHPDSNQHRTLKMLVDTPRSESEVCKVLGITQGYSAATIFNFADDYDLVYGKGHRSCQPLTERGLKVLASLNDGFSINIKDLDTSKSKADQFKTISYMKKLRIVYGDIKHRVIRYLAKNPGEVLINTICDGKNTGQCNKYAIALSVHGLVSVERRGRALYGSITPKGLDVYMTEIEPGEYEEWNEWYSRIARKKLDQSKNDLATLTSDSGNLYAFQNLARAMYENDAWLITHEIFGFFYPEVAALVEERHEFIRSHGSEINAWLHKFDQFETLDSSQLNSLIDDINWFKATGVQIDLNDGLGEFLMIAKLAG